MRHAKLDQFPTNQSFTLKNEDKIYTKNLKWFDFHARAFEKSTP